MCRFKLPSKVASVGVKAILWDEKDCYCLWFAKFSSFPALSAVTNGLFCSFCQASVCFCVCACVHSVFFFFFTRSLFCVPDSWEEKHVWVLGVICSLDLADPEPRSCCLLYPPDRSLVQRGTTQHHVRRGGERPTNPWRRHHHNCCSQLHPSYLTCHLQGSVQEGEKERWAEEEASWQWGFPVCCCENQTLILFSSVGKDGRVPTRQVSRRWREVQGQVDRHWWCSRGQRRQDVPGLHDETEGAASQYRGISTPLEFRGNIKDFSLFYNKW